MILATLLPSVVAGLAREADSVNARDRNSSRDEELLESSRSQLSYGADAGSWTSSPFVPIAIAGVLTMVAAVALGCVFRKSDKNRKEKDESAPPGSPKEPRAAGRMSESMMESRVMGRHKSNMSTAMAPGGNQAKVADASKGAKGAGKGKAVGKTSMLRSTVVMGPNSPATYQDIERKHQPRSTRYGLAKSQHLGKWTASTTDDGDSVDETMAKNAKAKGKGGTFGSLKGGAGGKSGNHDDVPMHRAPAVVADVSEPSDVIKRNTLALPGASPAAPKMPGPILTGTLNLQASPEWLKVIRNENADIATVMPPPPPTKGMPPPPPTKGMPPPPPTKGMPPPPLMKGKGKGLEPNKLPKPAPPVLTGGTLQLGQCNEWNEFLATQKEGGAMQALMKESPRKMPDWLKDPNDGKDGGPPERRPHTSKNPTMLINDEDNQDTPIRGKGSDDKRLDVPSPTQRKLSSERRQDAPSPGKPIADRRHEAPSPGKLGTPIPVKRKKRRPPMEDGEEGSPRLSPRGSNRNASPSDGIPLDGDERRKRPIDMDRSPRKKPKEGNEDSNRRRKERQKKMKEKEKDNEKEKEKDKEKVI